MNPPTNKIIYDKSHIIFSIKSQKKNDILEELITPLTKYKEINTNKKKILTLLINRENKGSTTIQNGIALPHTKSSLVSQPFLSLGITHNGVPFNSLDKKNTKIFILSIFPVNQEKQHLKFISMISRFLYDKDFRQTLIRNNHKDKIWDLTKNLFKGN